MNGRWEVRPKSLRRLTLAAVLALVGLALVGCWHEDEAATLSSEPVTLQFVTFDTEGAWGETEADLIAGYQELRPNVEVEHSAYSQFPQQYLDAPPPPDVMTITPGYFLDRAVASDSVADLSDVWQQAALDESLPPAFQALSQHGGKQYYLPVGYSWAGVYYNRETFEQLGLEPPATWDEFMLICDTLLANGVTPLALPGQDPWPAMLWLDYLILRLQGAEFHQELVVGQVRYDDVRVREAVELWSTLLRNGYFVEEPFRFGDFDSIMAIVRGDDALLGGAKAAMVLTGPPWLGEVPEAFRSELDFFPFPAIDPAVPRAETVGPYGYMVPAAGEHLPEALSLITYMASPEAQQRIALRLANSAAAQAPLHGAVDRDQLPAAVRQGMALVEGADAVVTQYMPSTPEALWQPIGDALNRFLRDPADVDSFLLALEGARQQAEEQGAFSLER